MEYIKILPKRLSNARKWYPNIHLEVQTDVGINLIAQFEKVELGLVVAGKIKKRMRQHEYRKSHEED